GAFRSVKPEAQDGADLERRDDVAGRDAGLDDRAVRGFVEARLHFGAALPRRVAGARDAVDADVELAAAEAELDFVVVPRVDVGREEGLDAVALVNRFALDRRGPVDLEERVERGRRPEESRARRLAGRAARPIGVPRDGRRA